MTRTVRLGPNDVLLVADVQNDFCPGGALGVPDGDAVVPVVNRLGLLFDHVVLTQDWHPCGHRSFASSHPGRQAFETVTLDYGEQVLWPDHCVQGTHGAAFHPALAVDRADLVIRKGFRRAIDSYSAFFENDQTTQTGLAGYMRERGFRRVFVCGLATDFCVKWSALDAARAGFEAYVVEDAARGIDLDGSMDLMRAELAAARIPLLTSADLLPAGG